MKNSFDKLTLLDIASKEKRAIISGPFGSNISSKYFTKQGIPVIRGNNLSVDSIVKFKDENFVFVSEEKAEELNTYAIENDIIFTAVGTLGQVGIIEKNSSYIKYIISNKQMRIRLDLDKVNPYYVYYWLTSSWILKSLLNNNTGSAVPLLNLGILKRTPIDLPKDRIYQDEVVSILSTLDKKIALNNQINQELEAMAKTLYDYWFVQFDFPNEEGKPYKSSGGKMVYSEELKREIPEGWEVKELSDVESNIVTGKTPPTKEAKYYNGDVPFISIGDIRGNMHVVSTEATLTEEGANTQIKKYIPKGSICVTCIASPGLVGFATEDSQTNQQINSVVCDKFENRYYLYFALKDYFKFAKAKTGNTFSNMNKQDFSEIKIIEPKNEILKSFSEILKPSIEKILNNSLETQKLTQLRDWLLPMLMNGQVSVADAKEQVDELMVAEPAVGYGRS